MSVVNASSRFSQPGLTTSTWQPSDSNSAAASPVSSSTSGSTRAKPRSGVHATLRPLMLPAHASTYEPGSRGSDSRSRSSPPAITSSTAAASRTVRASGPTCETWSQPGKPVPSGTRPYEGFTPTSPQNAAGMRTEPPPSLPSAIGPQPLATAAAAPPLLPPGVRSRFHGLRVTPKSGLSVTALWPNSDVVVLPRSTAPAAFSRPTDTASCSGRSEEHTSELQSLAYLVCRLLLEKKKKHNANVTSPPSVACVMY